MTKTILITGGAQGIGAALATAFLEEGGNVAIADLAYSSFELAERCLRGPCDVSDRASTSRFVSQAMETFGSVDILINNAGIYPMQAFEEISPEDWYRVMATNLNSVFHLSQLCIPSMKRNSWGRIINIVSNVFFMGC